MLYDNMVVELDAIFVTKWSSKFEPVQKLIDFYEHPQQTALLKSCAKMNKHSMALTGEGAVSTVTLRNLLVFNAIVFVVLYLVA